MRRRLNLTTNITRLPPEDWVGPRQPERIVIHPWDFDTPVSDSAYWEGDNIVVEPHRDEALIQALGNRSAWGFFTTKTE